MNIASEFGQSIDEKWKLACCHSASMMKAYPDLRRYGCDFGRESCQTAYDLACVPAMLVLGNMLKEFVKIDKHLCSRPWFPSPSTSMRNTPKDI
jgi:hypothetical protein